MLVPGIMPGLVSFPPQEYECRKQSLLSAIGRQKCVRSEGRRNPGGVKRKMSKYAVRSRKQTLNQKHTAVPVIIMTRNR